MRSRGSNATLPVDLSRRGLAGRVRVRARAGKRRLGAARVVADAVADAGREPGLNRRRLLEVLRWLPDLAESQLDILQRRSPLPNERRAEHELDGVPRGPH